MQPVVPGRPDVVTRFPPPPDATPPRHRRRRRFVALALVLSLLSPAVLGIIAIASDGDPAYAFLDRRPDGSPYRWEPCHPIHYEVNLDNAPPGAMADVEEAIARLSEASGLRFVFDGTTDRTPTEQRHGSFHELTTFAYRPVLISWLPSDEFDFYANPHDVIGVGIAVPGSGEDYWVYKSGLVVINADAPIPPGFVSGYSLGPVLMHELGHVVGLGHVGDAGEIMWSPDLPGSNPVYGATDWGDGDIEGLERLGRPAGCIAAAA